MKRAGGRAIQCAVVAAALAAEMFCASRYPADVYPTGQDGVAAEGISESDLTEKDLPEGLPADNGKLAEAEKRAETAAGPAVRRKPLEAATLTWEEVPVELKNREFTFGTLHVSLPERSAWEYEIREDGAVSVCLSATDRPAPFKKMYFTHYRVAWADTWELKLAALELTGLEEGRWFFFLEEEEPKDRTFGIELRDRKNRKNYYVFVCGEDLYLLEDNDIESYKLLFGEGPEEDDLTWDDVGGLVALTYGYSFYRLGGESCAFLEEERLFGGDRFVMVYRDGDFERPVQVFGSNVSIYEDINFDGYRDISVYDEKKEVRQYLLWSEEEGQFVEVVGPRNEDFYFAGTEILEEFEVIWKYDNDWDTDTWEKSGMTEELYRWEGVELKEMRCISGEIGAEEVFVELTEAGECLASGRFPKEGWQENPEVRKLYEQFYEGFLPREFYYTWHTAPDWEKCIPDALVELLSKALEEGTEDAALGQLKTGHELSDGETEKASAACRELFDALQLAEPYRGSSVERLVRTDLDNDGIEDIYARIYSGGSGGFADYILYRGMEDGGYQKTGYGSGTFIEAFTPICFDGKNYICRREEDYDKKIENGLVLEGYRDGKMVETVTLSLVQGETDITLRSCQEGYREIAEMEREKAEDIFDDTENFRSVVGDAEEKVTGEDTIFLGDIDNDGELEKYIKFIWTPSNMWTQSMFEFELEEGAKKGVGEIAFEKAVYENWKARGVPIMFWVDARGAENIVNVMYRTDLYDYVIEGYLPSDTGDYESLYLIEKRSERAVGTIRAGRNPWGRYEVP